mmetsp:Transcript_58472/g.131512  ORF Transcript_58472/g.131512 Transcript_58472/m.131512 type:complete len:212 (-) Transcript_58472:265-900(-)
MTNLQPPPPLTTRSASMLWRRLLLLRVCRTLLGISTLSIALRRNEDNAARIALWADVHETVHRVLHALCDRLRLVLHAIVRGPVLQAVVPHQGCASHRLDLKFQVGKVGLTTRPRLQASQVHEDGGRSHRTIVVHLEELARLVSQRHKGLHTLEGVSSHCSYTRGNALDHEGLLKLQVHAAGCPSVTHDLLPVVAVTVLLRGTMKLADPAL